MTPTPGWTPGDVATIALWVCAAISTVAGAITVVVNTVKAAKKPEQTQNDRLTACETEIKTIKDRLRDGNSHFASLDDGTTVTQQCILAMMDAQISGDNIDDLKKQRANLYAYLSQKGAK